MNFTNNYHIEIFEDFYSAYGKQIDKLWPKLKDVVIDVYDKDSAQQKDYIINLDMFGDMSGEINSPFQCYPKFQYHNQTFNDIILSGDLCIAAHLTQQEQFALIAHEIGHFVSKYKNTGLNGQADEFYAEEDRLSVEFLSDLFETKYKGLRTIGTDYIETRYINVLKSNKHMQYSMNDLFTSGGG